MPNRTARAARLVLTCVCVALLGGVGGSWLTERSVAKQLAISEDRIAALRMEVARNSADGIKRQIQSEMGLLPVKLLRERRESFVELRTVDSVGGSKYGTAGYLGGGYFITVKHAIIALGEPDTPEPRRIVSIKVRYKGQDLVAHIVDSGDADAEVHSGDWGIIRVDNAVDLPPLTVDTSYAYQFAEPIFRLGNDYSRGIIVSTGHIGQRLPNGLVTCLIDGHPGVSGGGVLDSEGDLVGIPVGRLESDYRFSFILPLRPEMFRKVPTLARTAAR